MKRRRVFKRVVALLLLMVLLVTTAIPNGLTLFAEKDEGEVNITEPDAVRIYGGNSGIMPMSVLSNYTVGLTAGTAADLESIQDGSWQHDSERGWTCLFNMEGKNGNGYSQTYSGFCVEPRLQSPPNRTQSNGYTSHLMCTTTNAANKLGISTSLTPAEVRPHKAELLYKYYEDSSGSGRHYIDNAFMLKMVLMFGYDGPLANYTTSHNINGRTVYLGINKYVESLGIPENQRTQAAIAITHWGMAFLAHWYSFWETSNPGYDFDGDYDYGVSSSFKEIIENWALAFRAENPAGVENRYEDNDDKFNFAVDHSAIGGVDPDNYDIYYINEVGSQCVVFLVGPDEVDIPDPATGSLKIHKLLNGSSSTATTEGIQFEVHEGSTTGRVVGTLTIHNGYTPRLTGLTVGTTYYIKETTAGPGVIKNPSFVAQRIDTAREYVVDISNDTQTGSITVVKASENPTLLNTKPSHYSLTGAQYGVYTSRTNAQSDRSRVGTITIASNGQGTLSGLDTKTYYVKEVTPPPGHSLDETIYTATLTATTDDTPVVSARVDSTDPVKPIKIKIKKTSSNTAVTNGNSMYSLKDAQFTIYTNSACTTIAKTTSGSNAVLTTDVNGNTPELELYYGTYYVKETKAPKGYHLNTGYKQVTLSESSANPYTVNFSNDPIGDPGLAQLKKRDIDEKTYNGLKDKPQGSATFSGAEYEVKFYGATTANSDYLLKTWKFRSTSTGSINLRSDSQKISGPALYILDGKTTYPLGTITFQETKPPEGYDSDKTIYVGHITQSGEKAVFAWDATSARQLENQYTETNSSISHFNTIIENPKPAIFTKKDKELTTTGKTQGDASIAGAVLSIINLNDNPVEKFDHSGLANKNGEVGRITLDASGKYTLDPVGKNEVLPVGTYKVVEVATGDGYLLNEDYSDTFTVTEDEVSTIDTVPNQVIRGDVEVYKVDKDLYVDIAKVNMINGLITRAANHILTPNLRGNSYTQGDADLVGITFNITNKSKASVMVNGVSHEPNTVVKTIETVLEDGVIVAKTTGKALPYGTYSIQEVKTNNSYLLTDGTAREFKIVNDGDVVYATTSGDNMVFVNEIIRGGVKIRKIDSELARNNDPQGDADLGGATFEIVNKSPKQVMVDGTLYGPNEVCKTITTGTDGTAATSNDCLPYGTYEIHEKAAGEGYFLNPDWSKTFSIRTDGQMVDYSVNPEDKTLENPKRGGLQIEKVDEELNKGEAVSGKDHGETDDMVTHLEGIKFTITNVSKHSVLVNGVEYQPGSIVKTITTHWNEDLHTYTAETTETELPYGTYELHEVETVDGYMLNSSYVQTVQIREPNVLTKVDKNGAAIKCADKVLRGDIEFIKVTEFTNKRLSVPFVITNKNTGERHVVVTDPNGEYRSSNDWVEHSHNKNGNDALLEYLDSDEEYLIKSSEMNWNAGLWFGLGEEGSISNPVSSSGALPYGEYTIEEMRCENNEGYELAKAEFTISRNNYSINLGTVVNWEMTPKVETVAIDSSTLDHISYANGTVTIKDTVHIEDMVKNETYTLMATMCNFDNESSYIQVDGKLVRGETTFVSTASDMDVEVTLTFDASDLKNMTGVVYEELYKNGVLRAFHKDINDTEQTIHFPEITTAARDFYTQENVGTNGEPNGEEVTIVDTVSYKNLLPGREYEMRATVYDKSTREAVSSVTTQPFTPEEADGTVDVTSRFKADSEGKTFVVYEELYFKSTAKDNEFVIVADHSDLNDELQTIYFPKIRTKALDVSTNTHVGTVADGIQITDEVSYWNLVPLKEYTVKGKLYNEATGKPLEINGKEITSEATVMANDEGEVDGTVTLTYDLDAATLENVTVVVYEDLYYKDVKVATHSDITDELQSIHFPKIRTSAVDGLTKDHVGTVGNTSIVDTVTLNNLIPDQEYTIKGYIMSRDENGKYLDGKGNTIEATTTFTAEAETENHILTYNIDASALEGKTLVIYEELYVNGVMVNSHRDINDEAQTIHYPKIRTLASDTYTKDEVGTVGEEMIIVDKVSYWNLIPGQSYTLKAKAYSKDTGLAVSKEFTKEFTPELADSSIEMEISFSENVEGKDYVIYEELYHNNVKVTEHSDLEDKSQTVNYPMIRTTAIDKNSQSHVGTVADHPDDLITIVDTVKYTNLVIGKEYTIKGKLMNKADGEPLLVDGQEITSEKTFVASVENGSIDLEFTLKSYALENTTVVVFEDIYHNSIKVNTHSDINDEDQTIHFPKIRTSAIDGLTKDHVGTVTEEITIVDTVIYNNFIPGQEYTVRGVLMDRETGEKLVDGKGNTVTSTTTLTAEQADGTVDLTFTFDSSTLEGKTIVVYEDLIVNEAKVDTHSEINDETQAIHYPKIRTLASDVHTTDEVGTVGNEMTIVDKVSYWNLIPGMSYTLKAKAYSKVTGQAVSEEFTNTFTPEVADSEITMNITFSDDVEGKDYVIFEELYHNNVKVTEHSDLEDKNQTVNYPMIRTTAIDKNSQSHVGTVADNPDDIITIVDTVKYTNLVIGKEYTLKGKLMNTATGQPLLVDGLEITAEKTFVADKENGSIDLEFKLKSYALENTTVVAFEDIYHNGIKVNTHSDLNDEEQTIHFPKIRTSAIDGLTKDHVGTVTEEITIVDTVIYNNFIPGQSYTINGTLMDRDTGKKLVDGKGNNVTATVTLVAEEADSTVDLTFTFDSSTLEGKTVVVYEDLLVNNAKVDTHSEINDETQTIHYPKIRTLASDKYTKDEVGTVGEEMTIVDKVSYWNLIPGMSYTLKAKAYSKDTGLAVSDEFTKTFTPDIADSEITMEISFSEDVEGKDYVIYEELYHNNVKVTEHSDIEDKSQTVNYPMIRTTAKDKNSNSHVGTVADNPDDIITIVDTVKYTNLVIGKEYTIKGKLINTATGEPLLVEGKEITSEKTFVAEVENGSIDLEFKLKSYALENTTVVVFEDIYHNEIKVNTHSDLTDEEQTIHFPKIRTSAIDGLTKDHVGTVTNDITIVDTVTYNNFIPGQEYTVSGVLMDRETGEKLVDGKGNNVTSKVTLVAEVADGSVDLTFTFDSSTLEGKTIVVYEDLLVNDAKVDTHSEINDENQAIHYPKIRTQASDVYTKDEVGTVGEEMTIVDKVSYWNLLPGHVYTLKATAHSKGSSTAVSKEFTKTFTPDVADSTIEMSITFKDDVAGKDYVVFEELYHNNVKVTEHSDINDINQTINYPKIGTLASDVYTKDSVGTVGDEVTIVDKVQYINLVVGKTYMMKAVAVAKDTGEVISKEFTSTFKPVDINGILEMVITFKDSVEGRDYVIFEELYHNGIKVTEHSDIEDEGQTVNYPTISTTAVDKNSGTHVGTVADNPDDVITIVDTVLYSNLVIGKEYTIRGKLMNVETGEPLLVDEQEITAETTFVAEKEDGFVELEFLVKSYALEGTTVVAFEDLYHNGIKVTTHSDLTDEEQSVHFPKIRTSASDGFTEDHVGTLAEETTIIDTVTYNNLIPNQEYVVTGTLIDKETGEPLLDEKGNPFIESVVLVSEEPDGTVDVVFTLNTSLLEGKTLVVFEDLLVNEVKVDTHSDITDENQTIHYPKIRTHAVDGNTNLKEILVSKESVVLDNVEYWNLIPGKEYTLNAVFMDKETEEEIGLTGTTTFTPEEPDGVVGVTAVFDSRVLEGRSIVAFESLMFKEVEVTSHKDITDFEQTVVFPKVRTTAKAVDTNTQETQKGEKEVISDTVTYSGLIAGETYTVKGTLMNKATGKPLLVDGKEVTSELEFIAEESEGSVELKFELDSSALAGTTVVVFESLYKEGIEISVHADIEDKDQSVTIVDIHTTAKDTKSNSKEMTLGESVSLTDTVTYRGLTVGVQYTLKGILMDKATGKALVIDGKAIESSLTFVPKESNGSVDIVFTFNTLDAAESTLVVFEKLYDINETLIAKHEDIEDKDQTVTVPKIPEPEKPEKPKTPIPQTLAKNLYMLGIGVLILGVVFLALYKVIRRNKTSC